MSAPSIPQLLVSHWQPALIPDLGGAATVMLYLLAVRRGRARWPLRRTVGFIAGVACVLIAVQSGLDTFDDQLLSAHMVQHMLLLLLAPLLLLSGQPVILVLRALAPRRRKALLSVLERIRLATTPVACLALFCAIVLLTHLPRFYDATLRQPALHQGEHILYLIAGALLWWPLLDGDPAPSRRLGALGRLVYVLVAMVPMAAVGAYLNRHASLVYPAYGPAAHQLGISATSDQQQAGAIMWVAGNVTMVVVGLWAAVAALLAEERRQQARDLHALRGGST